MMPVKCFFLEPTEKVARFLRRYTSSHSNQNEQYKCSVNGYHDTWTPIENGVEGDGITIDNYKVDQRWPKTCLHCGYEFTNEERDNWQLFSDRIYRRIDNGEEMTLRKAPDGAMWYADWMIHGRALDHPDRTYIGPDGHCLVVRVVGGHDWMVDAQASNCTLPDDKVHKCWCRSGDPMTGVVTVNKSCASCSAGAGSIQTSTWHGFLRDGMLVE